MGQLQAAIQLLVDFHSHDLGTSKLAALTAVQREVFLRSCAEALYAGKEMEFLHLCQSSVFRPILAHETGTLQPSLSEIHAKLQDAIVTYNESGFGYKFDPDFGAGGMQMAGGATPDFVCVQWVLVNGEWVKKFNYDLVVIDGMAPSAGDLVGAYRAQLSYTT